MLSITCGEVIIVILKFRKALLMVNTLNRVEVYLRITSYRMIPFSFLFLSPRSNKAIRPGFLRFIPKLA